MVTLSNKFPILYFQVLYDTSGFLEKNRDTLHSDSVRLLLSSSCPLLRFFASNMLNQSQKSMGRNDQSAFDSQKQSVGTKFKVTTFSISLSVVTWGSPTAK